MYTASFVQDPDFIRSLYIVAPGIALAPVLMSVAVLPWNGSPEWGAVAPGLNIGILFLLAVASIEVYSLGLCSKTQSLKMLLLFLYGA